MEHALNLIERKKVIQKQFANWAREKNSPFSASAKISSGSFPPSQSKPNLFPLQVEKLMEVEVGLFWETKNISDHAVSTRNNDTLKFPRF